MEENTKKVSPKKLNHCCCCDWSECRAWQRAFTEKADIRGGDVFTLNLSGNDPVSKLKKDAILLNIFQDASSIPTNVKDYKKVRVARHHWTPKQLEFLKTTKKRPTTTVDIATLRQMARVVDSRYSYIPAGKESQVYFNTPNNSSENVQAAIQLLEFEQSGWQEETHKGKECNSIEMEDSKMGDDMSWLLLSSDGSHIVEQHRGGASVAIASLNSMPVDIATHSQTEYVSPSWCNMSLFSSKVGRIVDNGAVENSLAAPWEQEAAATLSSMSLMSLTSSDVHPWLLDGNSPQSNTATEHSGPVSFDRKIAAMDTLPEGSILPSTPGSSGPQVADTFFLFCGVFYFERGPCNRNGIG